MNLQEQLDAFSAKRRQEELAGSTQLLLCEIILKLEAVRDKSLPVMFDLGCAPCGIGSWRGSYRELAVFTEEMGSIQTGEMRSFREGGDEYPVNEPFGKENPNVSEFLELLKRCVGATFTGYKGGDFKMSKNTPVSVCKTHANSCMEYAEHGGQSLNTWIREIEETESAVVLVTGHEEPYAVTE